MTIQSSPSRSESENRNHSPLPESLPKSYRIEIQTNFCDIPTA